MRVLLDSCIVIDYLAGRDPARDYVTRAQGATISLIAWMEVLVGVTSPEEEAVVRGFLSAFEVLPVDGREAEDAVALRRARRLELPDAIILATARVHGCVLATRNTKDFREGEDGVCIAYVL